MQNEKKDFKIKDEISSKEDIITDDFNFLLTQYNIDKKKFIVPINDNEIYNPEYVINNDDLFDLICPICLNIINHPLSCSLNINSHSFCKRCIDIYLEEHDNCPTCKNKFNYENNKQVEDKLNKLFLRCIYLKDGCHKIINYLDYFKHINECEFKKNNIKYECLVEKYNFSNKSFDYCRYIGNKKEMMKHFKICAFLQYECIFCKKNILAINLKEHSINNCKIKIYNDNEGDIYIGEIKNNKREGYGIYYNNGNIYKGEWKDSKKNGYGIFYLSNGDKYEGGWKMGKMDGYGKFYFSNGDKYEGEWKMGKMDGYGMLYFSNGDKYDGIWKNNQMNGYGKLYKIEGGSIEGEWKFNKIERYGILSDLNNKYEALFQNGNIYIL